MKGNVTDIKSWARESLGQSATVMVTELRCSKSECPSVETVIVWMGEKSTRRWRIEKPMAELNREAVHQALKCEPMDATVAHATHQEESKP
jgi:hypothetical protein